MKKCTLIVLAAVAVMGFASTAFGPASPGREVKGPASDLYYIYGEERASDGAMSSYWQPAAKPVVAAPPR